MVWKVKKDKWLLHKKITDFYKRCWLYMYVNELGSYVDIKSKDILNLKCQAIGWHNLKKKEECFSGLKLFNFSSKKKSIHM